LATFKDSSRDSTATLASLPRSLRAAERERASAGAEALERTTTVAQYLAVWLERRDPFTKPQGLRKFGYRTWAAAESRVRNHIDPLIGELLLAELDREDVVGMLGALAERGVRPPTLQKCRDHLVSALRQAIKERSWGILHNVAAAVDAPADPDAPTADDWYTLTAPEADAFLAHLAGTEFESLYEICLHLGLRQSEAFGLRWSDVDLTAGSLSIRQSLAPIRAVDRAKGIASGQLRLGLEADAAHLGRLVPLEPKTRHSRATLPLTATGIRLLESHHHSELEKMARAGAAWLGGDPRVRQGYVWTTALGMPITPSKFVLRHFKPLCKRAGIPTGRTADGRRGFRFHDMRHSTASIMAARGERPEVIQRVMRHAKVSFTLDRYVKVYRDDIRDAVQRNDASVRA
jgi:integrase